MEGYYGGLNYFFPSLVQPSRVSWWTRVASSDGGYFTLSSDAAALDRVVEIWFRNSGDELYIFFAG
jgi:hypothetical protein